MRGGIDKGFCLNYWRLSYRRKFIRDLWSMAIFLPLLGLLFWWQEWGNVSGLIALLLVLGVWTAAGNYRRWQADRRIDALVAAGPAEIWRQVAIVLDGTDIQVGQATYLIRTDESFTIMLDGKDFMKGTTKIVADGDPRQSDVTITEGIGPGGGTTIPQISKVEGDVLVACQARAGEARPTEFTSKPGTGRTLSVWLRVK
jgi:uncharacterized protein (TIGR03067 family)